MRLQNVEHLVPEKPYSSHVNGLYPQGLSKHGKRYLANPNCGLTLKEGALEALFEEVRLSSYPHLPSRFQSMFCCETLEDAMAARPILEAPMAPIYEIEVTGKYHRANMILLNNSGSILAMSYRAHAYWSGSIGDVDRQPFWEIVAELPVTVGKRVM